MFSVSIHVRYMQSYSVLAIYTSCVLIGGEGGGGGRRGKEEGEVVCSF